MEDGSEEGYLYKIVLIGDSAVGKSNLLSRYAKNEFQQVSKATIGVEFQTQRVQVPKGPQVQVQLWDTAGQERFRAVTTTYYRGAHGALLVYDITRRETFNSTPRWLEELRRLTDDMIVVMLVGNKRDMQELRDVSVEEGKAYAESEGLMFLETSALDSTNVKAAFDNVVKEIHVIHTSKKALSAITDKSEFVSRSERLTLSDSLSEENADVQRTRRSTCCSQS